tara:strand:- start:5 stop:193 length:189 start_codon:yes stop_codon:yes gene_type:complete
MYLGSFAYQSKNRANKNEKVTIEELYLSFGGLSKIISYFCQENKNIRLNLTKNTFFIYNESK